MSNKINLDPLLTQIGLCVIYSQSIEFLLRGIVTSFRKQINNKFISGLKPYDIFESTQNGKKLRRLTLGTLKNLVKEVDILDPERLEKT